MNKVRTEKLEVEYDFEKLDEGRLVMVPLEYVKPSPLNPRKHFDQKKMEDLTASIREKGILQPIVVRPVNGHLEIVCGERRYRAAKAAKLEGIPAIFRKLDDKATLELQVIENLQREDVHPLEEAEGYEKLLKEHGYDSVDDIAAKVGKSNSYVYGRMKLCDLIPANRKLFYEGFFSPSVALLVARIPAKIQEEAGRKIASGDQWGGPSKNTNNWEPMSHRKAATYIHEKLMVQLKNAPFDTADNTLCAKAGACLNCPKRTGNQQELFPDIKSADVCTDPVCFQEKVNAHGQRQLAKYEKQGRNVIKGDKAKKIFRRDSDELDWQTPWVDLDAKSYEGSQPQTYRNIFKKVEGVEKYIQVVVAPNGKVKELIAQTKVNELLKKIGVRKENTWDDNHKARRQEEQKKNKIRKELLNQVLSTVTEKAAADNKRSFILLLLKEALDTISYDARSRYGQWADKKLNVSEACALTEKKIQQVKSEDEAFRLLLELIIVADFPYYGSTIGEAAKHFCDHYGIDIKALEKKVREEVKAPKVKKGQALVLDEKGKGKVIDVTNKKAKTKKKKA